MMMMMMIMNFKKKLENVNKKQMRKNVVLFFLLFAILILMVLRRCPKMESFSSSSSSSSSTFDMNSLDKDFLHHKITYIHIPKTGGSALGEYLQHYTDYFDLRDHYQEKISTNDKKYLVVIREPLDRFKSIYQYWRQNCIQDGLCDSDVSLKMFISFIKEANVAMLHVSAIDYVHYLPQCHYIENTSHFKSMMVILYNKSSEIMNAKLLEMLSFLDIPIREVKLEEVNASVISDHTLDEEDMSFISYYYADDFILWGKLNNQSALFWKVF